MLVGKKSQLKINLYFDCNRGRYRPLFYINLEVFSINKQKKVDAYVNEDIRVKEMLVITNDGEKLGVLSRKDALNMAYDRGLDLVLVSPDSNPAVAKIMDYSKFRFEQQKKAREMKKNQKVVKVQEIRLSLTIEQNDLMTKSKNARKILEKGNKIKVSVKVYGRLMGRQELAKDVIDKFNETLADIAQVESQVKLDGKFLFAVLTPIKK